MRTCAFCDRTATRRAKCWRRDPLSGEPVILWQDEICDKCRCQTYDKSYMKYDDLSRSELESLPDRPVKEAVEVQIVTESQGDLWNE